MIQMLRTYVSLSYRFIKLFTVPLARVSILIRVLLNRLQFMPNNNHYRAGRWIKSISDLNSAFVNNF